MHVILDVGKEQLIGFAMEGQNINSELIAFPAAVAPTLVNAPDAQNSMESYCENTQQIVRSNEDLTLGGNASDDSDDTPLSIVQNDLVASRELSRNDHQPLSAVIRHVDTNHAGSSGEHLANAQVAREPTIAELLAQLSADNRRVAASLSEQMSKQSVESTERLEARMDAMESRTPQIVAEAVRKSIAELSAELRGSVEQVQVNMARVERRQDESERQGAVASAECRRRHDEMGKRLTEMDVAVGDEMAALDAQVIRGANKCDAFAADSRAQSEKLDKRIGELETAVAPISERLRDFRDRISENQEETVRLRHRVTELEVRGSTSPVNRDATRDDRRSPGPTFEAGVLIPAAVNSACTNSSPAVNLTPYCDATIADVRSGAALSPQSGDRPMEMPVRISDVTSSSSERVNDPFKTLAKIRMHELPTFEPDRGIHPVVFIRKVERYFAIRRCDINTYIEEVMGLLTGSAENWLAVDAPNICDFATFKAKFLGHYWSTADHARVRNRITRGRYNSQRDGKMADYFRAQVAELRYIDPPMTDQEITTIMMDHFDDSVAQLLKIEATGTVAAKSAILERIEPTPRDHHVKTNTAPLQNPVKREHAPKHLPFAPPHFNEWRNRPKNEPAPGRERNGDVRHGVYHLAYDNRRNGRRRKKRPRYEQEDWRGPPPHPEDMLPNRDEMPSAPYQDVRLDDKYQAPRNGFQMHNERSEN